MCLIDFVVVLLHFVKTIYSSLFFRSGLNQPKNGVLNLKVKNVLIKPIGKLNLHNLFAFVGIINKTRKQK